MEVRSRRGWNLMKVWRKIKRERQWVRMGEKEKIKQKRKNCELIDRKKQSRRLERWGGRREQQISRKTEQGPEGLQVVN